MSFGHKKTYKSKYRNVSLSEALSKVVTSVNEKTGVIDKELVNKVKPCLYCKVIENTIADVPSLLTTPNVITLEILNTGEILQVEKDFFAIDMIPSVESIVIVTVDDLGNPVINDMYHIESYAIRSEKGFTLSAGGNESGDARTELRILPDRIFLGTDEDGGLPISANVVDAINTLIQEHNKLVNIVNTHVHPGVMSGPSSTPPISTQAQTAQTISTSDIESTYIFQGKPAS